MTTTSEPQPDAGYEPKTYQQKLQLAIMQGVVEASLREVNGVRVAHIKADELLEALAPIIASMMATSPHASDAEGVKRILRRFARKLERQVREYRAYARQHGAPLAVVAG